MCHFLSSRSVATIALTVQWLAHVNAIDLAAPLSEDIAKVEDLSLLQLYSLPSNKRRRRPPLGQLYTVKPACGKDTEDTDMVRTTDIVMDFANQTVSQSYNTTFPEWIQRFCPHVVKHFTDFPYFPGHHASPLPVFTTKSAAHSVCSIQVAVHIAAASQFDIRLHAGSSLGAILHGGPIPWDDDVDMLVPESKKAQFMELCNRVGEIHPGVRVECQDGFNAIKFAVVTRDSTITWPSPYSWLDLRPSSRSKDWRWHWPYLDIFTFDEQDGLVREIGPEGDVQEWSSPASTYYPTKFVYFGGVMVSAPQNQVVMDRYDPDRCVLATYDHEMGRNTVTHEGLLGSNAMNRAVSWVFPPEAAEWLAAKVGLGLALDCCRLSGRFPFGYNESVLSDGKTSRDMGWLMARAQRGAAVSAQLMKPMLAKAEAGVDAATEKK